MIFESSTTLNTSKLQKRGKEVASRPHPRSATVEVNSRTTLSISTYGVCSLVSFSHSFIYLFIHSFIHSFIYLFIFHLIFQLIVSWTGHLAIFSNNLIDFIDSFNVTVKWIETLLPASKTEVDKIYSDIQSFGKATQSNLYVCDLSIALIFPEPHSLH